VSPLFRRRREAAGTAEPDPVEPTGEPPTRGRGPYDADEDVPSSRRLDLGALRVPVVDGMQIQLEVDRTSRVARSVTVVDGPSRVRISAFAAPRTQGVWDDVRGEISAEVTKVGGTADEVPGPFGTEVITTIPTRLKDGRQAVQVQRFAGVDGPRWFLRAVFSGPEVVRAAGLPVPDTSLDPGRLERLEGVVGGVVVVRGTQARPPREPLALALPATSAKVTEAAAPVGGLAEDGAAQTTPVASPGGAPGSAGDGTVGDSAAGGSAATAGGDAGRA
jgi:hypothetical protein